VRREKVNIAEFKKQCMMKSDLVSPDTLSYMCMLFLKKNKGNSLAECFKLNICRHETHQTRIRAMYLVTMILYLV